MSEQAVTRQELSDFGKNLAEEIVKALSAQIANLEASFSERINALQVKVDSQHAEAMGRIERVETSLLTEFHGWASRHESRNRATENSVAGVIERLNHTEDRVNEIERVLQRARLRYPDLR